MIYDKVKLNYSIAKKPLDNFGDLVELEFYFDIINKEWFSDYMMLLNDEESYDVYNFTIGKTILLMSNYFDVFLCIHRKHFTGIIWCFMYNMI